MKGVPNPWATDGYISTTTKKWIANTNDRKGWGSGSGSAVNTKLINNLKAAKVWEWINMEN